MPTLRFLVVPRSHNTLARLFRAAAHVPQGLGCLRPQNMAYMRSDLRHGLLDLKAEGTVTSLF
jgi:hypothetical protein